jgi:hypothetical protein
MSLYYTSLNRTCFQGASCQNRLYRNDLQALLTPGPCAEMDSSTAMQNLPAQRLVTTERWWTEKEWRGKRITKEVHAGRGHETKWEMAA